MKFHTNIYETFNFANDIMKIIPNYKEIIPKQYYNNKNILDHLLTNFPDNKDLIS